jgi:hypothetical protein
MNHLPIDSLNGHSLTVISLAVVGTLTAVRTIVKAVIDCAIYVLQEVRRLVKACRQVAEEVRKDKHRGVGASRRALRASARRAAPQNNRKPERGKVGSWK